MDPAEAVLAAQLFDWYLEPQGTVYRLARRLTDLGVPTPRGGPRWNTASVRGILRNPSYAGRALSNRTQVAPARGRKSAMLPAGPGVSHAPRPEEDWITVPVPAIVSEEAFAQAQAKLDTNQQTAARNTRHQYLLRALISCGACRLTCGVRQTQAGYRYYQCRGRTDPLRAAQGQRCTARYIPAGHLDELVWAELCELVTDQRLLDAYLAEIIALAELRRKRDELDRRRAALAVQQRQLDAAGAQRLELQAVADGIEAFCQAIRTGLATATFEQRRLLAELLIDRVIVTDGQVEIRYVLPTSPDGPHRPFCQLCKDHLDGPVLADEAGQGRPLARMLQMERPPDSSRRICARQTSRPGDPACPPAQVQDGCMTGLSPVHGRCIDRLRYWIQSLTEDVGNLCGTTPPLPQRGLRGLPSQWRHPRRPCARDLGEHRGPPRR